MVTLNPVYPYRPIMVTYFKFLNSNPDYEVVFQAELIHKPPSFRSSLGVSGLGLLIESSEMAALGGGFRDQGLGLKLWVLDSRFWA